MMLVRDFLQLGDIEKPCKPVEVEHPFVLAVFAIERYIFAEIHVLQMIGDKAAVAALNTPAKFVEYFFI